MMHGRGAAHDWRFCGNYAYRLFRCLTLANSLFEVRKGIHKEKRCYNWQVEIVEENGFVDAEALKGRLIENYDWPSGHWFPPSELLHLAQRGGCPLIALCSFQR